MKQYDEEKKKRKIADIMQNRIQVSFKVLQQLEKDEMLEDFDLFRVISDHFNDMYIFYMEGKYFIIDRNRKNYREIDRNLLLDRSFVLNRCITNNIQGFLQRYGVEAFNKLSIEELIGVMLTHNDSLLNLGEGR